MERRRVWVALMVAIMATSLLVAARPVVAETEEELNALLDRVINKPVSIFSKTYCPYCRKAKAVLERNGVALVEGENLVEIDTHPQGAKIQQLLVGRTGHRTVPQVFIAGDFYGGGDDTANAEEAGTLGPYIRDVLAMADHDSQL